MLLLLVCGCGGSRPAPATTFESGAVYTFATALTQGASCLDVDHNRSDDGTQIDQYRCNETEAQDFLVQDAGEGVVTLVNAGSRKCVDVFQGATAAGSIVDLWTCNGTPAQEFRVGWLAGGEVQFLNPNSGRCLAVRGGLPDNFTPVVLDDCTGSAAGRWQPRMRKLHVGTYQQQIDHASDIGTFEQSYWYTTRFVARPDSPVLFVLCGEWRCGPRDVELGDVARSLGAGVVALEHRYYGESRPFIEESLANYRFLTIHNAIEDAAQFVRFARSRDFLPSGPWIVLGGSYAGNLAAYFRAAHPELVVGAWAESAAVTPSFTNDFVDKGTARILGPSCAPLARRALDAADAAFLAGRGSEVWRGAFGEPAGPEEEGWFMWAFVNLFNVQTGRPDGMCDAMESGPEPLAAASAYARGRGVLPAGRYTGPWAYQLCTEYARFNISSPGVGEAVFPPSIDAAFWRRFCDQAVGAQPDLEKAGAYARLLNTSSNILFVDGADDPTRDTRFSPPGFDSFVVEGGSHWPALRPLRDSDNADVAAVHARFGHLATKWLAE